MSGTAMVIVEADNLRPTSPLRKAAESHKAAMALPCYALEARDIGRLIRQYLEQENYRIEAQAMDLLTARLATDRGVIQRELERLVRYMGVRPAKSEPGMVTGDDVEAALGDQAQGDFDRLIDSVALGRLDEADRVGAPRSGGHQCGRRFGRHVAFSNLTFGARANGARHGPNKSAWRLSPALAFSAQAWSNSKCVFGRAANVPARWKFSTRRRKPVAGWRLAQAQAGNALLRIARAAQR